jgi:hypothetical protein
MFFLPNTTTLLARAAINLLRGANQELLDEAIQTLVNRRLPANGVMAHLEQNARIADVLEKLARDWAPETLRVFASALRMEPSKTDVMDLIVAIAILNEPDLEAELRGENTTDPTTSDLLEDRRITWQYPPPGTPLAPPYVVLVAVEQIDTSATNSEVQAILGELVDYKGYKIARRATGSGFGNIRIPEILAGTAGRLGDRVTRPAATQPAATQPAASGIELPGITLPGMTSPVVTLPTAVLPATTQPALPAETAADPSRAASARLGSIIASATRLRGGV